MNRLLKTIPFFLLACLFTACCNHKEVVSMPAADYFLFGSGGGITGKYTEFKLHNDGTIEQKNFATETYEPYAKVDQSEMLPLFGELEKLALQDFQFSHPGNMTQYIEVHDGTSVNRVKWGDRTAPVRTEIEAFFEKANDFVRARKP